MARSKRKSKVQEVDTELTGKQVSPNSISFGEGLFYFCALIALIGLIVYFKGDAFTNNPQPVIPTAPIPIGGVLNVVYGNVEENVLVLSNLTEVQKICSCEACLGCYNKYAIGASSGSR